MKQETKQAIEQAKTEYQALSAKAKTEATRSGLVKINLACIEIVEHRKEIPTVNEVVLVMTRMHGKGNHPASQTIRNKRSSENLYKKLFDVWKTTAYIVVSTERSNKSIVNKTSYGLSEADINNIEDHTLKIQVALLLQKLKKYKNQLDILRTVEGKPLIRHVENRPTKENQVALTEHEKEAKEAFLDEKLMAARGYRWTKQGALKTLKGKMVAKPGLRSVLKKL